MEGTTFDMTEYNAELDSIEATVMPDSWVGHGRLAVWNDDSLTETQRLKAIDAVETLAQRNPDKPAAKLAEAAIPHVKEKFD